MDAADGDGPELHHVEEEGVRVRVEQQKGQKLHINASGHLPLSRAQAFALLMHPDNGKIFRHIEHCTDRKVLHDDGLGHTDVESEHTARWRLLWFTGTLATRLCIAQDFNTCTARFVLAPGGSRALREFHGAWAVDAVEDDGSGSGDEASGCWVHLEQLMQPAVPLPPPLGFLLKRIAANQVRGIFADLRAEAARIHAGRPTLDVVLVALPSAVAL